MSSPRVRSASAPVLLSLASLMSVVLLVSGCSGGEPDAGGAAPSGATGTGTPTATSPAPTGKDAADPKLAAFFACLKDQGLPMKDTPSGIQVVDPAKADPAKVRAAETACAAKRVQPQADAATLAKAKEFTACMRANGARDFPDPDPVTGDSGVDAGLKTDPKAAAALLKCAEKAPAGSSSGVVGG
ncbi:hypothetical protein OHA37_15750 [Streptomyces sp. NBC_00335]|uniref:hypothetical protein n=1 Tax=unclassified Streptomyces TaxID=2593676 RepID=UPI00224DEB3B|nr:MULTISPECIES: hypothetical protein [unclassified Streptomyces]MCX5405336.1 hypothetical protein [Streptomyces sp. NBC_00086]